MFVVALLVLVLGAGAFAGARTWHQNRRPAALAPTPSVSPTPTPAAVLAAGLAPSSGTPSGTAPSSGAAPLSGAAPTSQPPMPVPTRVAAALNPLLAAPALGGQVDALVADSDTGLPLLDRGASIPTPPASTAKLATAVAVLSQFPVTTRLTTRVVTGATAGQIVLVGGGDPTLSAAAATKPTLYPGAARLSTLAAQVRATRARLAVKSTITSVLVDTSLFTGAREAPGWAPEDVPSDYASAITALVVDGGLPATGGTERSLTPELEAGAALASLLGVPGATVAVGRAPPGATALGAVRSAPILDLVEQMLQNSDNVIAEMLGRQVAIAVHQPASFGGVTSAIRTVLAGVGIALPATLVDASGLSALDRLSPSVLVGLLRTALSGAHPRLAQLVSALPVSGWEGTLAGRYQTPVSRGAAGAVRAKTGTLTGVVTLAGIVRTADGRLLVFAVMTSAVPDGGTEAAEAAVDAAIARLAACGC